MSRNGFTAFNRNLHQQVDFIYKLGIDSDSALKRTAHSPKDVVIKNIEERVIGTENLFYRSIPGTHHLKLFARYESLSKVNFSRVSLDLI